MLIAFHKPFNVLSQFTVDHPGQRTLADFAFPKNIYPIGRLDADSEGLLLLSDEPHWNDRLLHPRHAHAREYWAQVERIPTADALKRLERGVEIQGRKTLPCRVWILEPQPQEVGRVTPCAPLDASVATDGAHLPRRCASTAGGVPRPTVPPRDPPIRARKNVPDVWLALELIEGKNRQVRRMTAAIGHPTLRLLRVRMGKLELGNLPAGQWRELTAAERALL